MTIQALKRVIWRVDNKEHKTTLRKMEAAIMKECGTNPRTIAINLESLKKLGWIKRQRGQTIRITGADVEYG